MTADHFEFSPDVGRIECERFFLRPLAGEDVGDHYLAWFHDPVVRQFISASQSEITLDSLRAYVAERALAPKVCFLGIFVKASGQHIGNIKFEPIEPAAGYAVMGVLLGAPEWRGRGVFGEVFGPAATRVARRFHLSHFYLGVELANEAAIRAYEKAGFREVSEHPLGRHPGMICMRFDWPAGE